VTVALVLLGGAVGAPLRYVADLVVQSRHDSVFPWGTFAVNVLGSLLLGVVAALVGGAALPAWTLTLLGTGLCGALTTFSTFGFETVRLLEEGSVLTALANAAASLAVALGACAAGWTVAASLV
jgi:CrcB protein